MREQHVMQEVIAAVGARPDTFVIRVNAGLLFGYQGGRVKGAAPGTADAVARKRSMRACASVAKRPFG